MSRCLSFLSGWSTSDAPGAMNRNRQDRRRTLKLAWSIEGLGDRLLLSAGSTLSPLLTNPLGFRAVEPNTPIMPFATPSKKATFIDPTVSIHNGNSVIIGFQNFIGPYAKLDGGSGAIKITNSSDILDNASIVANPGRHGRPEVLVGEQVVIGFGAEVLGPSTIGGLGSAAKPTSIGTGESGRV
jgi:hypothetical protein